MAVWAPVYINTAEGIGTSLINLIKGTVQLGTAIIDKSLDSTMGVLDIGAVAIMLMVLAAAVGYGRRSVSGVKAML